MHILTTDKCVCGRTGFRIEVLGRTDDMLTILGVNVYPLAIRDVVSTMKPAVSGAIEIQLDKPGPVVEPPLKLKVEVEENPGDKDALKKKLEMSIREKLIFRANVELVTAADRWRGPGDGRARCHFARYGMGQYTGKCQPENKRA